MRMLEYDGIPYFVDDGPPRRVWGINDKEPVMGLKAPQPNAVIARRLRRIAKWLDSGQALGAFASEQERIAHRARANTVWQAAARLEEPESPSSDTRAQCEAQKQKAV